MIGFLFLSLALIAVVLWLMAPTLLGRRHTAADNQQEQNVQIAKERLAEIENQRQQNEISEAEYNVAKTEIEFALLEDTKQLEAERAQSGHAANSKLIQRSTYLVISAIPFVALFLYQMWGSPDAISPVMSSQASNAQNPHSANQEPASHTGDMDSMIASLEAKLKQNPNNPNGWYILGRSYMVQKRYDKAVEAFTELRKQVGDDPAVLLGLADSLTMLHNGDMRGEPFELAKQALAAEPENTTALWLTGLGYQHNGDLKSALVHWQKLLPLLKDDPKSSQEVSTLIANAQQQLGIEPGSTPTMNVANQPPPTANANDAKLSIAVSVDAQTKQKLSSNDYVMIYAQRVQGLKMPLAMVKVQVKDLPMQLELSDANALSPMNKLSGEQEVNVIARVSKSGQAMKQADDIEVRSGPYKVTHTDTIPLTISLAK